MNILETCRCLFFSVELSENLKKPEVLTVSLISHPLCRNKWFSVSRLYHWHRKNDWELHLWDSVCSWVLHINRDRFHLISKNWTWIYLRYHPLTWSTQQRFTWITCCSYATVCFLNSPIIPVIIFSVLLMTCFPR